MSDDELKDAEKVDYENRMRISKMKQSPGIVDAIKNIDFAQRINDYRVFPRLMLLGVSYVVYHSLEKFWQLDSPTTEQTAVVGIVVGIIPAVIAFYQNSGKK